ncbi:methyltransferase family protein [Lacrimispora aerotolerans]|uniref:methyltransferase family protein n=1 Tax=Lacrimispora aerotolerans TaxID=36832 RepID=UPI00047DE4B1|nr:isoprenylcysteine carboxylmethyltransferase family protein [Lacrimispora aerotolerans]
MNGFFCIVPLLLIRFGVLRLLNENALRRAAFFAPAIGKEKVALWFYQVSNIFIFVYLCFLRIKTDSYWFYIGLVIYALGLLLCLVSVLDFAKPGENGINMNGFYQVSRNPMYVGYFVLFFGCCVLTQSWLLFAGLVVFQVSGHWIIRSEERWCIEKFGQEYISYMDKVRRYI